MSATSSRKPSSFSQKNPIETLRDVGTDVARGAANGFKDIGTGVFDQLFGMNQPDMGRSKEFPGYRQEHSQSKKRPEIRNVWNFQQESESRMIRELVKQVKEEIKLIKQADKALLNEVKDIEKLTIESLPSKPGIYHIRFLEIVISVLKMLRAKINESRTWLMAIKSKRKKRGSAFAALSKKKGTQFSLSQELQASRSVQ